MSYIFICMCIYIYMYVWYTLLLLPDTYSLVPCRGKKKKPDRYVFRFWRGASGQRGLTGSDSPHTSSNRIHGYKHIVAVIR